jgi:DNA polymerase-1
LVTNLVLCQTDDPPKAAINACRNRLRSEIENVNTIIACGSEAVREFIGPIAIQKARGLEHKKENKRIIATNNPAAVLYDSDSFPNLVEDFKLALNPPPSVVLPEVKIYDSEKEAKALFDFLSRHQGLVATDLEGHSPHIECAGFSIEPNEAHVLTRRAIVQSESAFRKFYESKKDWLWHNGVYDVKLLRRNQINSRIVQDTYPLSYVLDERTTGVHNLEYLARMQLGWTNYEPESVEHYKDTGELPEDITELYEYNGYDCAATLQLYHILINKAREDEVEELYNRYIPRLNALVDVELRGFFYDDIAAADLNEEIVIPEIRKLKKEMQELVGLEFFNPASNPQTQAFVYDTCGLAHNLKDTKKRKFSRSFSDPVRVEVLEGRFTCNSKYKDKLVKFAELHDNWSEIDKQRGTYIEGLIKLVAPDGKLYCTFNPCGTVTGRWSGRTPNFQNITRTGKGVVPAIRTLFKPSPGNVIVSADFSQAELRCIAQFSGDVELSAIYRESTRSLHKETAAAFYGEDYTKDEYVKSKNINFGVCFGQSAFAFAQMYHMPQEEAQAYIDNWFKKFPTVLEWINETNKRTLQDNYLTNPFGRKRRFYLITEENVGDTLREGVNFLPQSTAADFTIEALHKLNTEGVPIISTVHDSIIADVPQNEAMDVALLMKKVMETQPKETIGWDLPFKVDISMSDISWGHVEEIELEIAV